MASSALSGVNRTTLREQVLSSLRGGILSGTIPPGGRLAEVDLAEQLGVSRGTVREALRSLQESGLVVGAERTGLSVRRLSPQEVVDLFQVRSALESLAIEIVMAGGRHEEVAAELERALPVEDPSVPYVDRLGSDLAFHEKLCTLTGNSLLVTGWLRLRDLMVLTVLGSDLEKNADLLTVAFHRPIVEAIRTGDVAHARDALASHMRGAAEKWSAVTEASSR